MVVIAIETSCDETAIAVVRLDRSSIDVTRDALGEITILAERVWSQVAIHEQYGGVVPEIAAREHLRVLPLLLDEVLTEAGLTVKDLDGIAVTQGPGLKGALLIGFSFAKGMAAATGLPLVGVNHVEGHLLSPLIHRSALRFPFLSLIASGGHTELVEAVAPGEYRLICRTMDDAAGEAFDKAAALLGFRYPGGAALSQAAERVAESRYSLPRVMLERPGLSFSGLKTAVALLVRRELGSVRGDRAIKELVDDRIISELSFSIEKTIVEVLVRKTMEARAERGLEQVAVAGGVAANRGLRDELHRALGGGDTLFFADRRYCSDNAVMIGLVGAWRLAAGERLAARSSVCSRWPIEQMVRPPSQRGY